MVETKKRVKEEAEQAAAHDEPMGSVAAAVPRDEGSAASHNGASASNCNENPAPPHKGGHATITAGSESHIADNPKKQKSLQSRKH